MPNNCCEEKDLRETEELCDDFCQIEKEVNELFTVASNGYIEIDYEIQKLMKKLRMLIDYVLSIYNLDE